MQSCAQWEIWQAPKEEIRATQTGKRQVDAIVILTGTIFVD